MASKLNEDRLARKQGEINDYEDYEVVDGTAVYTNSLIGLRSADDKVEPVDPANIGSYQRIGLTEDHLEADDEDRTIRVEFGRSVELDADTNLSGGEVGSQVYPASDHEFALTQAGSEDPIGRIRDTMGSAVDRAMVRLNDLA